MVNYLLDLVNIHTSIRNNFGLLFQDKVILNLFILNLELISLMNHVMHGLLETH